MGGVTWLEIEAGKSNSDLRPWSFLANRVNPTLADHSESTRHGSFSVRIRPGLRPTDGVAAHRYWP